MKKTIFVAVFLIALTIPAATHAYWLKSEPAVTIAKDEVVDGNLYAAGASIIVDGKVNGDIFCAGQNIVINGSIAGDIFCAGHAININGVVGGSARLAGNSININSQIEKNIMAFGASVYLSDKSTVGWEALIGAAVINAKGKIGRALYGGAAEANISGAVDGNINLRMDNKNEKSSLIIAKEANIGGDLNYTSRSEANIENGAKIKGKVNRHEPKISETKAETYITYAWGMIYSLFSSLVIGLVLIAFWKDKIIKLINETETKIGPAIGWGIIILFLTPIIGILLIISLIGAPLALILAALWIVAIMISKVLVGIGLGKKIMEKFYKEKSKSPMLIMVTGVTASWLIFSIPVAGWLISLVAIWMGLGGLFLFFRKN
jgi:hypothetical protein